MFQSLKGISAFWNPKPRMRSCIDKGFNPSKRYRHFGTKIQPKRSLYTLVSIPQRDIGILERPKVPTNVAPKEFQSLKRDIGILELKNSRARHLGIVFQSLKGISAFWNIESSQVYATTITFQSLKGISAFWNKLVHLQEKAQQCIVLVSIPQRDIGILEHQL